MANTYVDYTVGASQTDFAFSFPYLDDTHVVVQLDDSTGASPGGKFYTVSTGDYSIITSPSALIRFSSAPETGARIRIKRDSASDTALVDFENGSVLTEVELDRAYLHNLYLSEEIEEGSGKNTMTKDPVDGNYDADLAKIKNLADPTNPQDAVTKNYADITFVDVAGDTMTGNLILHADPSSNLQASTKQYVDDNDALQVTKTGDSMSGDLTLPATDPTNGNHATRKSYVDAQIAATLATGTAGGPINTVNISDAAITTDKIDDDAVTADKLANTTVTPGAYTATNLTVDAQGRITAAANGSASPTAAEVKTLYESNANTNQYDDAEKTKLAGIAACAQVNTTNTDGLTQGSTNLYNQTHTGDVTGSTALTIADNAVTASKISDTDSVFSVNDSTNVVGVGGDINISKASTSTEENIKITNNHASAPGECRLQFLAPNASTNVTQGIYGYQPNPGQLSMTISDGSGGFQSMAFNSSGNLAVPGTVSANGVVLTSDQTLKQDINTLNEAEGRVAVRLKSLIRKFRFIKEVQNDTSKIHVGVNAQEVQTAFTDEGLDSNDYAVIETSGPKLGVRYNELFAFIISAL